MKRLRQLSRAAAGAALCMALACWAGVPAQAQQRAACPAPAAQLTVYWRTGQPARQAVVRRTADGRVQVWLGGAQPPPGLF